MRRSLLLLAPGLLLTLFAGGAMVLRGLGHDPMPLPAPPTEAAVAAVPEPVAAGNRVPAGLALDDAAPPAEPDAPAIQAAAEPEEPPRPAVRHGAEGLGIGGGFACAMVEGVRRCRASSD